MQGLSLQYGESEQRRGARDTGLDCNVCETDMWALESSSVERWCMCQRGANTVCGCINRDQVQKRVCVRETGSNLCWSVHITHVQPNSRSPCHDGVQAWQLGSQEQA